MRTLRPFAFLAFAILAASGVGVVYVVMVRTAWGQAFDELALAERAGAHAEAVRRSSDLLRAITEVSLAALGAGLAAIALVRRRVILAAGMLSALGGAIVTSEILKHVVFERPALSSVDSFDHNSFPSGHATIGMSLALATIVVVPHAARWLASILAAFVAVAFGSAVVTAGWHRPSDTLGAFCVALAWFCLVTAVLLWWRGSDDPVLLARDRVEAAAGWWATSAVSVVILGIVGAGLLVSVAGAGLAGFRLTFHYVAALAVIDVVGVAFVGIFHLLMREVSPAPPATSGTARRLPAP